MDMEKLRPSSGKLNLQGEEMGIGASKRDAQSTMPVPVLWQEKWMKNTSPQNIGR
jgi:hypothetical protein